ncbi:MAG: FAD-dependent oxidoreductase [Pseudomonadota bacterium]
MTQHLVVVGGGQAAASFLARFRKSDPDTAITLVSAENHLPYQRPPLSKKYATGDMKAEQLLLRPGEWYAENHIDLKLGSDVQSIDLARSTLALTNGDELPWSKMLLATGSRPRMLPANVGGDFHGVYCLRSITDADGFAAELVEGRKVVIIGGGYIGLEAAAVCASKGLDVTLVEAADRILQRVACPHTSRWFRKLHEDRGVRVLEGAMLERLEGDDGIVKAAILKDGTQLDADFVLVGIGIVPNSELAASAGLAVDGGIVVDANCRTSNPDIYAAGDCAVFQYKGELTRLESVQNAIDQAECAASNLAGEALEYMPYPWFWSDQYDVKLQIAGLNRGYDEIVVREGGREGSISHFYFSNGEFLAVDSMNDPRTYMVCKKLLESGRGLTSSQAVDTTLELKSLV